MSKELLVIGFDLATGREVHVDDQSVESWRRKGQQGDGSLVCLFCLQGWDCPEPRQVPLVVKGRIGGQRRPHFAHPPSEAPVGGHGPETRWHAEAKRCIARWAESQPDVVGVVDEQWIPGRVRRSDVLVELRSGAQVAFELQQQSLTDHAWRVRHRDYVEAGITDVWLWHPATGCPELFTQRGTLAGPSTYKERSSASWWTGSAETGRLRSGIRCEQNQRYWTRSASLQVVSYCRPH
ncbi:competence protein CoiA family protein [Kribbella sp. NPDC051587]|uniref:competence protein CoiA family protein n=1 Tax=Kribbella sp. NPDC051587 TaxID=3364119 RepID=UPI00379C6BF5